LLELAEDRAGRLFLVDNTEFDAEGNPVCEVTAAEAWSFVERRFLPPGLRRKLAKAVAAALAD
jgi:hypothetical protein